MPSPTRLAPAPWSGWVRLLEAAAALPLRWLHRARSRRALLALDERALRDIGLTRDAARREAERPFWR